MQVLRFESRRHRVLILGPILAQMNRGQLSLRMIDNPACNLLVPVCEALLRYRYKVLFVMLQLQLDTLYLVYLLITQVFSASVDINPVS